MTIFYFVLKFKTLEFKKIDVIIFLSEVSDSHVLKYCMTTVL